jgi:hypothetical protein
VRADTYPGDRVTVKPEVEEKITYTLERNW